MAKDDDFLLGFLGSIAKTQERNQMSLKDITAIEQARAQTAASMSESGSEFAKQKPDIGLIGRMAMAMSGMGQQPREVVPGANPQIDYRPAILGKAPLLKDVLTKPITKAGEATNLAVTFGNKERSPYYSQMGFDEDTNLPVSYDAASNKYFKGGEEVPANEIKRLLSKTRPQLNGEQLKEIGQLMDARNNLNSVKSLFDPNATGPIESKITSFSRSTGIDFGMFKGIPALADDKTRLNTIMSSAINDYIKAVTGAQMTDGEARRIMNALPQVGSADEAFMPALQEVLRITDQKLNTRIKIYETQGSVGTNKLRDLVEGPGEGPKTVPLQNPPANATSVNQSAREALRAKIKSGLSK